MNYVDTLSSIPSLRLTCLEYLSSCPRRGKHIQTEIINRTSISILDETELTLLISFCTENKLDSSGLYIQLAKKALSKSNYVDGVLYYAKAKQGNRVTWLCDFLIREYLACPNEEPKFFEVVDSIPDQFKHDFNDRLTFLSEYRKFNQIYAEKDYKNAGALLCLLMSSQIAPKYMWVILIAQSLDILKSGTLNTEQVFELMRCFELVTTGHLRSENLRFVDDDLICFVVGRQAAKIDEFLLVLRGGMVDAFSKAVFS